MSAAGLDTQAGDVLVVKLKGDVEFGMTLSPDRDGCAAIVTGWTRLANGKFGPIQKNGGIHIGDALFSINDTSLLNTPHDEVLVMLNNTDIINKTLRFHNISDHYNKKRNLGIGSAIISATKEASKPAFVSLVRRTRIDSGDRKPFVEYEISCKLRLPTSIQRDENINWSVWKRYSEFEALDAALRQALGWQMDGIVLPSSHALVFNKLSESFIEQRRRELDAYWQSVIQIDKLVEFHKHHCSTELKAFLKVDEEIIRHKSGIKPAPDPLLDPYSSSPSSPDTAYAASSSSTSSPVAVDASAPGQRPPMRRQGSSTRRLSAKPNDPALAAAAMSASASAPPPPPAPTRAASSSAVATSSSAPPPPRTPAAPASAATAAPPAAAARAIDQGALPPKATGARANLLGDISRLRKD